MENVELHAAEHVCTLVKDWSAGCERAADLSLCVSAFMADNLDQHIDALLRGILVEMVSQ